MQFNIWALLLSFLACNYLSAELPQSSGYGNDTLSLIKVITIFFSGLSLIASTRIFLEKAADMLRGSSSCYAISSTSQLGRS